MFKEIKFAPKSTHSVDKKQNLTSKGNEAEALAIDYLKKQGLKLLCRQYRCKMGEIDIIMREGNEIVFVEVRSLAKPHYYEPFESITPAKQRKLILTATFYLNRHDFAQNLPARFDVISITDTQLKPKITWIPNAFGVE